MFVSGYNMEIKKWGEMLLVDDYFVYRCLPKMTRVCDLCHTKMYKGKDEAYVTGGWSIGVVPRYFCNFCVGKMKILVGLDWNTK